MRLKIIERGWKRLKTFFYSLKGISKTVRVAHWNLFISLGFLAFAGWGSGFLGRNWLYLAFGFISILVVSLSMLQMSKNLNKNFIIFATLVLSHMLFSILIFGLPIQNPNVAFKLILSLVISLGILLAWRELNSSLLLNYFMVFTLIEFLVSFYCSSCYWGGYKYKGFYHSSNLMALMFLTAFLFLCLKLSQDNLRWIELKRLWLLTALVGYLIYISRSESALISFVVFIFACVFSRILSKTQWSRLMGLGGLASIIGGLLLLTFDVWFSPLTHNLNFAIRSDLFLRLPETSFFDLSSLYGGTIGDTFMMRPTHNSLTEGMLLYGPLALSFWFLILLRSNDKIHLLVGLVTMISAFFHGYAIHFLMLVVPFLGKQYDVYSKD